MVVGILQLMFLDACSNIDKVFVRVMDDPLNRFERVCGLFITAVLKVHLLLQLIILVDEFKFLDDPVKQIDN
ncbi:hypothetical protein D3C75_999750 [compost metagenome]